MHVWASSHTQACIHADFKEENHAMIFENIRQILGHMSDFNSLNENPALHLLHLTSHWVGSWDVELNNTVQFDM
jgi:hypothetical protein